MRNGVNSKLDDQIYSLRWQTTSGTYKNQLLVIKKLSALSFLCMQKYYDTDDQSYYKESHRSAFTVIDLYKQEMKKNKDNYNDEQKLEFLEVLRKAHALLGRSYFHHYLIALEWNRPREKKFYLPRIRVMKPIVDDIQKLWDRELKLLAISMPAGTGKSTLGILAMTWVIGMDWEKPSLMTGYGSQLTHSFYMGVKSIIEDNEYAYASIFPHVKMVRSDGKDGILDYRGDGKANPRRIPTLQCISIEGAVTGRGRCENLLYSDDLVNGIEEGLNRDRLESKWMKYVNDFRSRAKKNYVELIIGTRWSLHDPIGKLRAKYGDNPKYKFIEIPALNEEGESNFDYTFNVGFDTQYYNDLQDVMDEISFMCQCQQTPIERDGLSFAESTLTRYFTLPKGEPDNVTAFCDVAFGGGDFVSFPVINWYGEDGYVVDVVFDKRHYKLTEPRVKACIVNNKVQSALFEANNGGEFYANDIAALMKNETHKCNITSKKASSAKSKLGRIIQYKPDITELYFKDKTMYKTNDDYGKFMLNLTTFVEVISKNSHDDAPDSLAGAMSMVRKKTRAEVIIGERRGSGL